MCCQHCFISGQPESVASASSSCRAAQVTPVILGAVLCRIAYDCEAHREALRPIRVQGDGGEAFRDLDDSDNAVTAAHALTEVLSPGTPSLCL